MACGSSASYSKWSRLPSDVLDVIMGKLVDISNRVRTAAVCKSWLSVFQDQNVQRLKSGQCQLPMLLIPTDDNSETHRGLYSVAESRVLPSRLCVPYNRRCSGSSHGWLMYVEDDLALTLFNPFSGDTIQLPPLTAPWPTSFGPEYDIRKVVLSEDPSLAPKDYQVLALCGFTDCRSLALFKAGAKSWIYTKDEDNRSYFSHSFQDITYFKGNFFAVNCRKIVSLGPKEAFIGLRDIVLCSTRSELSYVVGCGDILMWIERIYVLTDFHPRDEFNADNDDANLDSDDASSGDDDELSSSDDDNEASEDADDNESEDDRDSTSDDDHMHIQDYTVIDGLDQESTTGYFEIDGYTYGYRSDVHHLTSSFKVYQFMLKEGKIEVVDSQNLNGHALFLGDNQACSVLASDYAGCKPDSIYYLDDWSETVHQPLGPIDIGVFDLEKQCTRPLYVPGRSQWRLPPPIWIVPQANRANIPLSY